MTSVDQPAEAKEAVVVGGSGFVGSAVVEALSGYGWSVRSVPAPRLTWQAATKPQAEVSPDLPDADIERMSKKFERTRVVINAAGDPDASSTDSAHLLGANALLPAVLYSAAARAGAERFIHVSSAVVQGDGPVLDSSLDYRPHSPYAESKALGEQWLLLGNKTAPGLVIYRPPSVHARGRRITETIRKLGALHLASFAGTGQAPTPQALLANTADAIAYLATASVTPPSIVHHPWEGLTTSQFLELLSGRPAHRIPRSAAKAMLRSLALLEPVFPRISPNRRRLEILWFGQSVAPSWLEEQGWSALQGPSAWSRLAGAARDESVARLDSLSTCDE